MGVRITTWNVNGIRNPFQYQPWRSKKTFQSMFEILEADIVIFQETKIQRKDLRDDMVLVQGWDSYWSLPKHKKGYSGVVIYTKQSVCAPVRAEEGITGTLCPPNSSTSFSNLPIDQQIGGYPTSAQLADCAIDASTIDSEGRCVILEFPAFVLLGVYSPANRDESRDDFRLGFLNLLDARIRNLTSMGKRVVLAGDLNVSREELDTANPETLMRKNGLTAQEYISMPSRRILNQLLLDGKVVEERDKGREDPVLWDICRAFHQDRKGMFTCWEQKVNARPSNCGARIDYILSSPEMKDWFSQCDIQEGLMGSDHCPVYAVIKDKVVLKGAEVDLLDVINPLNMFEHGQRRREYSTRDILPLSGRCISEFEGRRSIRDMFAGRLSLAQPQTGEEFRINADTDPAVMKSAIAEPHLCTPNAIPPTTNLSASDSFGLSSSTKKKRSFIDEASNRLTKRSKSGVAATLPLQNLQGQQSLKGFFQPKVVSITDADGSQISTELSTSKSNRSSSSLDQNFIQQVDITKPNQILDSHLHSSLSDSFVHSKGEDDIERHRTTETQHDDHSSSVNRRSNFCKQDGVHDPIESKESWSKLFSKPAAPRCEGHDEPCISLLTKKSGINCGRSFWICPRPLGPTGSKEKNTQWRCQTFIWCSDWNSNTAPNPA